MNINFSLLFFFSILFLFFCSSSSSILHPISLSTRQEREVEKRRKKDKEEKREKKSREKLIVVSLHSLSYFILFCFFYSIFLFPSQLSNASWFLSFLQFDSRWFWAICSVFFSLSLLHFTVFSFFFHFPLTLLPPSLSCFSLSHFPTLLQGPIHHFLSFHSLNDCFPPSESLGFLISLDHLRNNSSETYLSESQSVSFEKKRLRNLYLPSLCGIIGLEQGGNRPVGFDRLIDYFSNPLDVKSIFFHVPSAQPGA